MKRWIAVILLLAGTVSGKSQYTDRLEVRLPDAISGQKSTHQVSLTAPRPALAAGIRVTPVQEMNGALLIAGRDTFALSLDRHGDPDGFSNLVLFRDPVNSIKLIPGSLSGVIELILIPAGHALLPASPLLESSAGANSVGLPPIIDQRVWRTGLPEPQYERVFNLVRNVIIHHTATSNQVTDYTAAVRSIYLYHIQGRGWSDIGYNYLIAPNGVIYKGRDPGPYPQDEVLGAHFCSSNTGTLGISLLGDYQSAPPPTLALLALERLAAWKLAKDFLDPHGIQPHPLNPSLDVIAGHRNGCATLCPGDQLYALLPGLRNRVSQLILHTGTGPIEPDQSSEVQITLFPNPVGDQLTIDSNLPVRSIRVLDSSGRVLLKEDVPTHTIQTSPWPPGWYLVQVITEREIISKKITKVRSLD